VLAHFGFSFGQFFNAIAHLPRKGTGGGQGFPAAGSPVQTALRGARSDLSWSCPYFRDRGLPHILVRFYTVPDAKTARQSVVWAMILIGSFYIMTTFLGFGAATIVGRDFISTAWWH